MILILDDDPVRHRLFSQNLLGANQNHVRTAQEALDILRFAKPNVILLDYDLDQFGLPADVAGCGMDVASYLIKNAKHFRRTYIVVHSLNALAGPAMHVLLQRAGLHTDYRPRAWLDELFCDALVARDRAA